ncbi:uncharacterized protein BDV17DRAFT_272645 [Aspergillus undulatus]|uniref:uncharacterized protein n=1 Tax=Aspergillus undulatus TaxID=1810928 RepID=UPI003CCCF2D6
MPRQKKRLLPIAPIRAFLLLSPRSGVVSNPIEDRATSPEHSVRLWKVRWLIYTDSSSMGRCNGLSLAQTYRAGTHLIAPPL